MDILCPKEGVLGVENIDVESFSTLTKHDHLATIAILQVRLANVKNLLAVGLHFPRDSYQKLGIHSIDDFESFVEVPRAYQEEMVVLIMDVVDLLSLKGSDHPLAEPSGFLFVRVFLAA